MPKFNVTTQGYAADGKTPVGEPQVFTDLEAESRGAASSIARQRTRQQVDDPALQFVGVNLLVEEGEVPEAPAAIAEDTPEPTPAPKKPRGKKAA